MLKLNLQIEIEEVNVFDNEYYDINYKYKINKGEWQTDMIEGDYENGQSQKEWKKTLLRGAAMEEVFQKIADDFEVKS